MKTLIANYTFNAATKQVALTDYTSVNQEGLLLITNVTDNIIIYNFADPTAGGTILGNVITLTYNTVGMSDSDKLQIFYDTPTETPATDETLTLMKDQNDLLRRMVKQTECLGVVDVNQQLRVNVNNVGGSSLAAAGIRPIDNGNNAAFSLNATAGAPTTFMYTVPDFWRCIELARASYNTGIRANLTFS